MANICSVWINVRVEDFNAIKALRELEFRLTGIGYNIWEGGDES